MSSLTEKELSLIFEVFTTFVEGGENGREKADDLQDIYDKLKGEF